MIYKLDVKRQASDNSQLASDAPMADAVKDMF